MVYKLKYYSLSKEEKKDLKKEFYKTDVGKNVNIRLKRLIIFGTMGIFFSIYLFILRINIWDLLTGIVLLLISIFFIAASFKIRVTKLNDYLVSKRNKK